MQGSFRLKGASLEEIRLKAVAKYGPGARIAAAELVTTKGVAGLFAGSKYEAVIHVDPTVIAGEPVGTADAGTSEAGTAPAGRSALSGAAAVVPQPESGPHLLQRSAIASLLAAADATESRSYAPSGAGGGTVSTESDVFAKVLEQFTALSFPEPAETPIPSPVPAIPAVAQRPAELSSRTVTAPRVPAPAVLAGAGDLIVLLGLGSDALDAALEMSLSRGGADVRTAGELTAFGHLHVDGRVAATAARAQAVENRQTVILAVGLGRRLAALPRMIPAIEALRADQVWAVVDVGRKSADSRTWLDAIAGALELSGLISVGAAGTSTPESIDDLGWPVSDEDRHD